MSRAARPPAASPDAVVPPIRVAAVNDAAVREDGDHVLYWMIAARRTHHSFALDRALAWSAALGKPLVVLEPLRVGYRWASDRLHAFVLAGMADNRRRFAEHGIAYHPYVEPSAGAGRGLLAALAERACVVVTDDYPCFFLPRMVAAAGARLAVRLEAVDGNGVVPLRAPPREFPTAHGFRRWLHANLGEHLAEVPTADPLADGGARRAALPDAVLRRWPAASEALLAGDPAALVELPIDHGVAPSPIAGGAAAGAARLAAWIDDGLDRYGDERSQPDAGASSGLSPYLHFGHVATHQVLAALAAHHDWSPADVSPAARGNRAGYWGMPASSDAFLDELVTWRELGFNFCARRTDYDRYASLPPWARATLAKHARDARPVRYDLAALDRAETYDPLWNAAQRQLVDDGIIHNYMRMLWGKKILEWSATPEAALDAMIALNDRYALDGRDPNSYSGMCWVLGRYDRAWGPERPIFGTIRYMSSESTARKLRVKGYLARHGGAEEAARAVRPKSATAAKSATRRQPR